MKAEILMLTLVLASFFYFIIPCFCSTSSIYVGIYYYVWYDSGLGNRHWNSSQVTIVIDKPLYGFYNSQDTYIIRKHLEWFKELQIDFLNPTMKLEPTTTRNYTTTSMRTTSFPIQKST